MSWTLVLQIILLTITLGFFLVLFGSVWFTYSTRKYEAMARFYEAARSIEQIRAEVRADMFEAMTKGSVENLFRGDEDGLKSG